MKIVLDEGAKMPTRGHATDAGLDLYAREDFTVPGCTAPGLGFASVGCAVHDTGVHAEIPEGYVGFLKSKSGLNVRSGLTGEGVIDAGYTGSIVVKMYNHTENAYHFRKGEKVIQLVLLPIITPDLELVESLEETERGTGGFGSTGR